jgi:hypothetical protein
MILEHLFLALLQVQIDTDKWLNNYYHLLKVQTAFDTLSDNGEKLYNPEEYLVMVKASVKFKERVIFR